MSTVMKFTLDGESYELDGARLTFGEGRAVEKVTGLPIKAVGAAAVEGSLLATQAFVWVAMKRRQPTLKFSDLDDVVLSDVQFQADEDDDGADDEAVDSDPTRGGEG